MIACIDCELIKQQCFHLFFRSQGGAGAVDLARAVVEATQLKSNFKFLYPLDLPILDKIEIIAKEIYGADGVELSEEAQAKVELYTKQVGFHVKTECFASETAGRAAFSSSLFYPHVPAL